MHEGIKQGNQCTCFACKVHFLFVDIRFLLCVAGIFFVLPCIDDVRVVDLRTVTFDVPPQEVSLYTYKHSLSPLPCTGTANQPVAAMGSET